MGAEEAPLRTPCCCGHHKYTSSSPVLAMPVSECRSFMDLKLQNVFCFCELTRQREKASAKLICNKMEGGCGTEFVKLKCEEDYKQWSRHDLEAKDLHATCERCKKDIVAQFAVHCKGCNRLSTDSKCIF